MKTSRYIRECIKVVLVFVFVLVVSACSIQKDVSKKGIKVTGFYPGFMQTDIFKKAGNNYDTSTGLEVEKVAKAIDFIINCDEDVIIPEFGIKDIENY